MIIALKIPEKGHEIILNDNQTHSSKMNSLFPALVGVTWKKAITEINKSDEIDYAATDKYVKQVADARNAFLHKGQKYAINAEMPEACLNNIWPLLNIFVALHNKYVFPVYSEDLKSSHRSQEAPPCA
jgi:hypothetical protein